MTARLDFAQLELHFVDQMQWRYELIRPLVLLAEGTPTTRGGNPPRPDTVRTFTRRFRAQGMLGLLPNDIEVRPRGRAQRVPEAVRHEVDRLKAAIPAEPPSPVITGLAAWLFVNFDAKIPPDWNDLAVLVTGFSMSIVAPHVRKHLSADALFHLVRHGFASLPDHRLDDTEISLTDALMSAFAMFSLKAPSLLAFDKERAGGNAHHLRHCARPVRHVYARHP